jgi:hypothetical protein
MVKGKASNLAATLEYPGYIKHFYPVTCFFIPLDFWAGLGTSLISNRPAILGPAVLNMKGGDPRS